MVNSLEDNFGPFSKLTAFEKAKLELFKKSFTLSRGQYLNKQHNPADGLYYIISGFVKIVWPEKNSKESIIKIAPPGDMTGYRCLFSEVNFQATAISLSSPVTGFYIPKELFFEFLGNNPEFNFEILKRMGQEIRRSENRLRSFCQKNVRERVAEALLELNQICGNEINDNGQVILDIQLTREEFASWIGTAKETVVRCLSDMREENIIDQVGNSIVIKNLDAIRTISNSSL